MQGSAEAWARNFREALHRDVNPRDAQTMEQGMNSLQALFAELVKGGRLPSAKDAEAFRRIRDTAFAVLSDRLHMDTDSTLEEAYKLGISKNHDYGLDNIPKFGVIGLIVRLSDKLMRAENLLGGMQASVTNEKAADTLIDIVNYSTYAIMLCNGIWAWAPIV